jgi:hypothetical protein
VVETMVAMTEAMIMVAETMVVETLVAATIKLTGYFVLPQMMYCILELLSYLIDL